MIILKINFSLLEESLNIDKATFLVLEEYQAFSNCVKQVYQYSEEGTFKIFSSTCKSLKESELMVVTDIMGFDVNISSVLKLIYADLEDQLNEKPEIKSKINQLTSEINDIMNHELLDHEIDLEEDEEITFQELFKVLGIKIETKSDSIFERIIEIVQIFKYLSKKKLLILVNTSSYLTDKELKELVEYISLLQIDVLFIEPRKRKVVSQYVIDEDFFVQFE